MSDLIPTTEENRLRRALEKKTPGELVVTYGTHPSGDLTIAHAFTFITGTYWVKRTAEAMGFSPKFVLGINDLDSMGVLDSGSEIAQVHKGSDERLEEKIWDIQMFAGEISEVLEAEIEVSVYSDMEKEPGFKDLLHKCRKYGLFKRIDAYVVDDGQRILCDSQMANGHIEDTNIYLTQYMNRNGVQEIDIDEHTFTFENFDLMALRDIFYGAGVHVLGPDYKPNPPSDFPEQLGKNPHYFYTNMVLGGDREEMHNSGGNVKFLKDMTYKGDDWVDVIVEIAEVQGRIRHYDYGWMFE